MSKPQFLSHRRVQFFETDMAGIVHFSNFFRWMEETEHEFFRSLGLKIMHPQPDGTTIGWPRVSASCNYTAPARYEQEIEGRLTIDRIGLRSVTYTVEFFDGEKKLATGHMKTACCICREDGSLTSIDLPNDYRQALEQFSGEVVASLAKPSP